MNSIRKLSRRNFISLTGKGIIISAFLPSALEAFANSPVARAVGPKNTNVYLSDPNLFIQQLKKFTDTYKKYLTAPAAVREIECLRIQHPLFFCDILDQDLFAGRTQDPYIGLVPQVVGSFGYYIEEKRIKALIQSPKTTPESKIFLSDLI